MAKNKNEYIAKLLGDKKVIRTKISYPIILGQIIEGLNYSPKELFSEQSLDTIWFRLSKIENVLAQITADKNFKRDSYKKSINKLYLDNNYSEENIKIISQFMDEMDFSVKEVKERIIREMIDVKEKFQLFVEGDLSKAEKLRAVKEILELYHSFIKDQLKKERQVQTPIGKYSIRVNSRFGTKSVSFDVANDVSEHLLETSDKNIEEIEKQRDLINKNIIEQDKHLERLKK